MKASRSTAQAWVGAGLAWVAAGLLGLSAVDGSRLFYATELAWLVVHLLVLVGIVGLLRADVTGDARWGRFGLQLAAVARIAFFAFEVVAIVEGTDEIAVFPIAVVGTAIGMLVGGLAIARTRRLDGWGRFAPMAVGAYPLVLIFPVFAATGERPPDALVAGWGLTLVAVGLAVSEHRRSYEEPGDRAVMAPLSRSTAGLPDSPSSVAPRP